MYNYAKENLRQLYHAEFTLKFDQLPNYIWLYIYKVQFILILILQSDHNINIGDFDWWLNP